MRLRVKSISCQIKSAEMFDEPYLRFLVDGHFPWIQWGPVRMREGWTETVDRTLDFDSFVTVELWEADPSTDDYIGSFTVRTDSRGSYNVTLPQRPGLSGGRAYGLSYEVTREESDQLEQWDLELVSLRCADAQEREDEIYITVDNRTVWGPASMRTGQTRTIGGDTVRIGSPSIVQVWERDTIGHSELFGTLTLDPARGFNFGRVLERTFSADRNIPGDATYVLSYRVREIP
jgi:hypothetical protein